MAVSERPARPNNIFFFGELKVLPRFLLKVFFEIVSNPALLLRLMSMSDSVSRFVYGFWMATEKLSRLCFANSHKYMWGENDC